MQYLKYQSSKSLFPSRDSPLQRLALSVAPSVFPKTVSWFVSARLQLGYINGMGSVLRVHSSLSGSLSSLPVMLFSSDFLSLVIFCHAFVVARLSP